MGGIVENLREVRERVVAAALRGNRNPGEISIIAVTKNQTIDTIKEGIQAGINIIGENRVQELIDKYQVIGNQVQWHLIGHLQTNKVKYIVDKVQLIHSLDSLGLAEEIEKRAAQASTIVNVLIQVNVSGEESKFGIEPSEVLVFTEEISKRFERVKVKGLMTIAPFVEDPEETRPFFRQLRQLSEQVNAAGIPGVDMDYLSMGMTNDFEIAVEEGANLVRIGRAIFNTD